MHVVIFFIFLQKIGNGLDFVVMLENLSTPVSITRINEKFSIELLRYEILYSVTFALLYAFRFIH